MSRRPDLVEKYGLDYELRFKQWIEEMKADPTVYLSDKELLFELRQRGIIEKIKSPAPFCAIAWRIK